MGIESWEESLAKKIEGSGDNSAKAEKMAIDRSVLSDVGDDPVTVVTPEEGLKLLQDKYDKLDEDIYHCEMCKNSDSEICEYHSKKLASLKDEEALLNTEAKRIFEAKQMLEKERKTENKPIPFEDDGLNFTPYGDIQNHD